MYHDEFDQSERRPWQDLWNILDWDGTREEVNEESRARILILGLANAGKSTLLNRLCGWTVSQPRQHQTTLAPEGDETYDWLEDFGLFCLIDLPEGMLGFNPIENEPISEILPLELAGEADLLVYVLDGKAGAGAIDYRWIGRLRQLGKPLVVALNKCDLLTEGADQALAGIESRLAATVIPISALTGANVLDRLLTRIVEVCPALAVPLGRELRGFRRQMANHIIWRTAIFNGFIALEPLPLFDIPLHLLTLVGMVLRITAVYDHPPSDTHQKEIVIAIAGGLARRYITQQIVKLVPVVGWLASGAISVSCTWLLGQAAVVYFEAGGETALGQNLKRAQSSLHSGWQSFWAAWQERTLALRTTTRRRAHLSYSPVRWFRFPFSKQHKDGAGPGLPEEEG